MKTKLFSQQVIFLALALFLLSGCGVAPIEAIKTPILPAITPTVTSTPENKEVLLVLYPLFEEDEYSKPRAIFEHEGYTITIASSSLDTLTGHLGMEVIPDILLRDVHSANYDAIIFIGGYGYKKNDPEAQRIAQEAVVEEKLLAAICVAPITLAKAGVVDGKKVTASTGASPLEAAGAIFTGRLVEQDELLITGNGPAASQRFGETIVKALNAE